MSSISSQDGSSDEDEAVESLLSLIPAPSNPRLEDISPRVEHRVENPVTTKFTWKIDNYSQLQLEYDRLYSHVFFAGGYNWQLKIYPLGNDVGDLYFSIYLGVETEDLPDGWAIEAEYTLGLLNQTNNTYYKGLVALSKFHMGRVDSGLARFMDTPKLNSKYVKDGTLIVVAKVAVVGDVHGLVQNTRHVGLKNRGVTCSMNSLLQTLYYIPYFRKAAYRVPTTDKDTPSSTPLALQILFYKLQYCYNIVETGELIRSCRRETGVPFMQKDMLGLFRVLCTTLESNMKGTAIEDTIHHLFEGHHRSYVECKNVSYKSSTIESFHDLQLVVKGCRDVYDSFDKYVEVKNITGYLAGEHGLQDARKYTVFVDFPPVLLLRLQQTEYDSKLGMMKKINDRYEFPLQLDLDREDHKYYSPDAKFEVRNLYTVHSVIVHRGWVDAGQYYALIRPTLSNYWIKFDDEKVCKKNLEWGLDLQHGGGVEAGHAYMLVYIRESDKEKILCNVDIEEQMRVRLKQWS